MRKFIFLCLLLFSISIAASSQIVNTESARMQSDTVGWLGGAGLAFSLNQNKETIFGLDAEAHFQYKTSNDKGLWLLLGNYGFLRVGKDDHISNQFIHFRYNRKVNDWLRWEFFTQFQNNAVTQIDSRFLFGTGPRYKIIKTKYFRLYAATLFMYEREREKTIPVVLHNDIRNSDYVSFTWTPKENIELISTTFFQPLLKKLSDYRILNQAALKVKGTKHFSLSLKWNYLHDRFPAGEAPRTTYSFATGLDFEL